MTEQVLIHIRGLQTDPHGPFGDEEPIEIVVSGQRLPSDGICRLIYDEVGEDTEDVTHNEMHIHPNTVISQKRGAIRTDMVFEKGKRNLTAYETPYGSMEMGIATTDLSVTEEEDKVTVHIAYALSMNEHYVADCTLDLTAESTPAAL